METPNNSYSQKKENDGNKKDSKMREVKIRRRNIRNSSNMMNREPLMKICQNGCSVIEEVGGKRKMTQPMEVDMMKDEEMKPKRSKKKGETELNDELKVMETSLEWSPGTI